MRCIGRQHGGMRRHRRRGLLQGLGLSVTARPQGGSPFLMRPDADDRPPPLVASTRPSPPDPVEHEGSRRTAAGGAWRLRRPGSSLPVTTRRHGSAGPGRPARRGGSARSTHICVAHPLVRSGAVTCRASDIASVKSRLSGDRDHRSVREFAVSPRDRAPRAILGARPCLRERRPAPEEVGGNRRTSLPCGLPGGGQLCCGTSARRRSRSRTARVGTSPGHRANSRTA
jgi:hypothetical protein